MYPWRGGGAAGTYRVPEWFSCPNDVAVGRWVWKTGHVCNDADNRGRVKTEPFDMSVAPNLFTGYRQCNTNAEVFITCFDFVVTGPAAPTPAPPPTPQPTPVPTPAPTPYPAGTCIQQTDCNISPWCNDDLMEFCLGRQASGQGCEITAHCTISSGPAPAPTPPPPAPPAPQPTQQPTAAPTTAQPTSAPTPSPAPGSCRQQLDCNLSAYCNNPAYAQYCAQNGAAGYCPGPMCTTTPAASLLETEMRDQSEAMAFNKAKAQALRRMAR